MALLVACDKKQAGNNPAPIKKPEEPVLWLSALKVASYNIEYQHDSQVTDNFWSNRKILVKNMFDKYAFDIVGVQEPYYSQLQDMVGLLPNYAYIGKSVYGNTTTDKQLSVNIFYKKSRIEKIKWDSFWFSDTPTVPGAAWGAGQWRICTWAFVRDKLTNKEFYFFSVHLDFTGTESRTKSVSLLLDTIPKIAKGYPAILTGDFNFSQHDQYYPQLLSRNILKDTYTLAETRNNENKGTLNGYDINQKSNNRIDHILVNTSEPIRVNKWNILTDTFDGKFASDHFPVCAELCFQQ